MGEGGRREKGVVGVGKGKREGDLGNRIYMLIEYTRRKEDFGIHWTGK